QKQQSLPSPSPRRSLNGTPPRRPFDGTPPLDRASSAGIVGFSPRHHPAAGAVSGGVDSSTRSAAAADGGVGGAAADEAPALSSGWGSPSPASTGGVNAAGVPVGGGGDNCAAGGKSEDGPWGLGIPPPGGGGVSGGVGGADSSADMEEAGHTGGDRGHDGWESDEGDRENGSSTEQLLQDAFASLSLHEKCALSLHVSHQQQGAAGKDAGA
ncbi:unnamed protein product, partial [Ectocarpus sp. 12 AP-2014]